MENTEKKIKVLIKPQCDAEIRNRFITKFGEKCEFVFEENEIRDSITTAEVVIGEPEESELRKAENLHWIQLTWAGADKYTKMKIFPETITLTNASGAFGKIISEYVIGTSLPCIEDFLFTGKTSRNVSGYRIDHQTPYMEKMFLSWEPVTSEKTSLTECKHLKPM